MTSYRLGWDAAGPNLPIGVDFDDGNHTLCTVKADPLRQDFLRLGKGEDCHGCERQRCLVRIIAGSKLPTSLLR